MNQGYAYKVVNRFPGMEKEDLKYGSKVGRFEYFRISVLAGKRKFKLQDEQLQLLQKVLAASDADAEEEDVKEENVDGSIRVRSFVMFFPKKTIGGYCRNI